MMLEEVYQAVLESIVTSTYIKKKNNFNLLQLLRKYVIKWQLVLKVLVFTKGFQPNLFFNIESNIHSVAL